MNSMSENCESEDGAALRIMPIGGRHSVKILDTSCFVKRVDSRRY